MPDYNKISLRFTNYGLNISHDPASLPFGKYSRLTNLKSEIEGQFTAREGMTAITASPNFTGEGIIGVRRLNDSIRGKSTYVARTDSKLDVTVDSATDLITSTNTENAWLSTEAGAFPASGFADGFFGSLHIDRTALSNQTWCYVGDTVKMVKVAITTGGGLEIKNVGIARPTGPPTFAQSTNGSLTLLGTYYYRYTLYDSATGVESLFQSAPFTTTGADATVTLTGSNDEVVVTIPTETVDSAVTHARIYRKGGTVNTWRLVGSKAYTGTTVDFNDTASDLAIAGALLLDEVSDKPFVVVNSSGVETAGTPLPYLWGPVAGYTLACGDPNNPGYLYWSNKFNPDSMDPANKVEVTSPQDQLMNGFTYDGKAFVWSKEGLYSLVVGLIDSSWTPFKTPCGRGLFGPHAFCVGPEIYFLAKDGVYATSGGTERALTTNAIRPLFEGESVQGYIPIDFTVTEYHRMVFHGNQVWLEYRGTDGNIYCLIYDLVYRRWIMQNFRNATVAIYSDEAVVPTSGVPSRLLLGGGNGRLYLNSGTSDANGSPTTIPCELLTGLITLNAPHIHKEWGSLILDINPNSVSTTVSVFTNKGATTAVTTTFSDATRTRKVINLSELEAEDIAIGISWASSATPPILYGYSLLYRSDAMQLTRWAVTETDHGIQGWQILRSGYIALKSDGTCNLAITVDNLASSTTTYNYSIASTGGVKKKVFIPFDAIKGKLFTYTLTIVGATYFRLYNEDCEVHVKPWISSFGYHKINPFVGGQDSTGPGLNAGLSGGEAEGNGPVGGGDGIPSFNTSGSNLFSDFSFLGGGGSPLLPSGFEEGEGQQEISGQSGVSGSPGPPRLRSAGNLHTL